MPHAFVLQQQMPAHQQFTISQSGLRIGRTPDNAIRLADDAVSRHHATVWAQGEQVFVRDEGTTNGTLLRGQRIPTQTPQPVQVGDEIRIATATPLPQPMAIICCRGGSERAASAITTALSPDNTMLIQMIFSSGIQNACSEKAMTC